jgi:hypothetical protein
MLDIVEIKRYPRRLSPKTKRFQPAQAWNCPHAPMAIAGESSVPFPRNRIHLRLYRSRTAPPMLGSIGRIHR